MFGPGCPCRNVSACPSRLAARFEHGRFKRLARVLAGPQHELEGLVVALAGIERHAEQHLALAVGRRDSAAEHKGMAGDMAEDMAAEWAGDMAAEWA